MIPGLDLLGIGSAKWNIKATLAGFPDGFALGLFADETFGGSAIKNVRKLLDAKKIPAVRAHLNWQGPKPAHQPPPLAKIKRLAPQWEQMAKDYPETDFYISPSCEMLSVNKKVTKELLELTQSLCPSCKVIQSLMKSPIIPGYIVEKHGKTIVGANQFISYDGGVKGEGLFDIDAEGWVSDNFNAEIAFAWAPLFNMAEAHNTLKPNQRTASPSKEYIIAISRLFDKAPVPPVPTYQVINLQKPLLYKLFAEDSPGEEKRHNRPLAILNENVGAVDIVTYDDQLVGRMARYGGFPGGMTRYYSGYKNGIGLYGYQIADKAMKMSGSPYVSLRIGHVYHGMFHPGFRTPFYQA